MMFLTIGYGLHQLMTGAFPHCTTFNIMNHDDTIEAY